MNIISKDSRLDCPIGQSEGVYYVIKKNTIARFTFGKRNSSFKNITSAFNAMTAWLENRKDAEKLNVRLLTTHF